MSSEQKRLVYLLPNIFTALNLACGFTSIMLALDGRYYEACMFLILGSIFDSVDGRVARLTGTQSSFGEQFDSMSDLVTFGMAPAFLIYVTFLNQFHRLGLIITFAFILCGALRLARFNANIEKVSSDNFQGLPIPAAALAIVGLVLMSLEFTGFDYFGIVALLLTPFYALLMISTIPFPSFKHLELGKRQKKLIFILIISALALTFIYEQIMVALLINGYLFGSLVFLAFKKGQDLEWFSWKSESDRDDEI